jgi:amidase
MTTSMEGVKIFMKSVLYKEPWQYDPLLIHKKWSEDEYNLSEHNYGKELCFGVLWDDGILAPHPPVKRGLEMAKLALIHAGHKGTPSSSFLYD